MRVDYTASEQVAEPSSLRDAVTGKHSRLWKIAIKEHLQSLEANHTWTIVDTPPDTNLIDTT
jgi:hypothetical protein